MVGVIYWAVAVFAIFLLLKESYDYKGLISWRTWIKEQREDWREWWKHLSTLRKTYFRLTVIIFPIFIGSFILIFPQFIIKIYDDETSFYNLSLAVFAIFSGLGAVFGFYTSIIRTETAEQGQITERLNKAIENLGKNDNNKPVLEVRLGALYALERIAKDSIRDHIQIMEILFAYVRSNSPEKTSTNKNKHTDAQEDIKAAITIIARRGEWPEGKKRLEQELQKTCAIRLYGCDLRGALLYGGNMRGASFIGSHMQRMVIINADLSGAWICSANITDAQLDDANMKDVRTERAYAHTGDFSYCLTFTQEQINKMFLGKDVQLADGLEHPQKGTDYYKTYNTFDEFFTAYEEWEQTQ